ncbi:MAG: RHS repeat domain-containing protein, partial [Candidatus Binatia bacterium]
MHTPLLHAILRTPKSALLCLTLAALCLLPTYGWPCGAIFGDLALAPPEPNPKAGNINHTAGEPVDLSTGLFVYTKTDLFLPDVLSLTLTRTYRTNDARSRVFGIGATHPYDLFLVGNSACTSAELILPDGSRMRYTRIQGSNCSTAVLEHSTTPTRFFKSILFFDAALQSQSWVLKLTDGTVYRFKEQRPGIPTLSSIEDPNGNTLTLTVTFGVPSSRVRISAPQGRWLELTHDADFRITQARDHIGRIVGYEYDSSGRLFRVTDPTGGVTEYTYDSLHRMKTIKDARGIV